MPIWSPSSSSNTTSLTEESVAGPCRSTVTELTIMPPSADAVRVILVAGIREAFTGANESPGWLAAETVRPVPVGTGGGGVPGGGGGVGAPATSVSYLARLRGPKYPAVGETPFAACHLETAAWVREPKYVVSPPGDAAPLEATWNPAEVRYCCRHFTPFPVTPLERSRVKPHVPAGCPPCCAMRAFNCAVSAAICAWRSAMVIAEATCGRTMPAPESRSEMPMAADIRFMALFYCGSPRERSVFNVCTRGRPPRPGDWRWGSARCRGRALRIPAPA